MSSGSHRQPVQASPAEPEGKGHVITTEDEVEGFRIIRAIVTALVLARRVVMRDAQSYCAILLDDNNRKPIARLFFDGRTKRIALVDSDKNFTRVDIDELEDLYQHADALRATVQHYLDS